MEFKFSCALLLMAALLAGCAAREPSQQPDQSALVAELTADSPIEEILVDKPDSPYPMIVESWSVDMDGDGDEESIALRAEKGYDGNEIEPDKWFEVDGMHPYTLVVTQGGTVYELPLGRKDNSTQPLRPLYWDKERTGRVWTQDRSDRPVLLLWFDGLSRELDLYAAASQDGKPVLLSAEEIGAEWPDWTGSYEPVN